MRKNNVSLALMAVIAACGAINAANAQSPVMPGAPMATPAVTTTAATATKAVTPPDAKMPTPIKDRFEAKGHVTHFQNLNQDAFASGANINIQHGITQRPDAAKVPIPLQVNAPVIQAVPSMGVFNPNRRSINN